MNQKKFGVLIPLFILFLPLFWIISCDTGGCGLERQLNVNDPDVEIVTSNTAQPAKFLSLGTTQLFIFNDQKVVMTVDFDNREHPFPVKAEFHVFDKHERSTGIDKWVYSHTTDVIPVDAAKPIREEPLPAEQITIASDEMVGHVIGDFNKSYAEYLVQYDVNAYTIQGLLTLEGFSYEAKVYLEAANGGPIYPYPTPSPEPSIE